MRIKILGIGQSMRGDDEVGIIIVQRWMKDHRSDYPDTIEAEVLESPGITLLGAIAGLDAAVMVDAVRSGALPGTLHHLTEEEPASFTEGTGSAHGWGVAETLSLGHQLVPEDMPERIIIIGVETVQFELGEGLSPEVRASVPKALKMINEVLRDLQKTDRRGNRWWLKICQFLKLQRARKD